MLGAFGQLTALQYSATASAVPLKYDIIIGKSNKQMRGIVGEPSIVFPILQHMPLTVGKVVLLYSFRLMNWSFVEAFHSENSKHCHRYKFISWWSAELFLQL